jgi:hypothetical protein
MNNSDFNKKLEEILEEFGQFTPDIVAKEMLEEATTAIKALMIELIDTKTEYTATFDKDNMSGEDIKSHIAFAEKSIDIFRHHLKSLIEGEE